MKTQGTQTVRDPRDEKVCFTENEGSQEDEGDHHQDWSTWDPILRDFLKEPIFEGPLDDPGLRAALRTACKRAFVFHGSSVHRSSRALEQRVIKRFGRLLQRYPDGGNRDEALEKLAINLLRRDEK